MSPEQVQGKELDARSDIFSFGCMLYEAATGKRPFDGQGKLELAHAIVHGKPDYVRDLNPECPDELRKLIGRCLQKERERRYQSMKEGIGKSISPFALWFPVFRAHRRLWSEVRDCRAGFGADQGWIEAGRAWIPC